MKYTILKVIGGLALALTLVPSMLVFNGSISLETHRTLMFIGTVIWLVTAPMWMGKQTGESDETAA